LIANLALVVLIMRMKFFAALHHTFIDRVTQPAFYSHRNSFLHPITDHLTKQDFSSLLSFHNLSVTFLVLLHGPHLAFTLHRFGTRNIPPYRSNTANIFNLTGSKLKTQIEEFLNEFLDFLTQFLIAQFT
jgi:hypothetical protein